MKQIRFVSMLAGSALLVLSSCNKDENKDTNTGFRIITEKSYSANAIDYTENYFYTNNKLTKVTSVGEWDDQEIVLTYPNANTIIGLVSDGQDSYEVTITLANNKVVEFVIPGDWKETYSYNSDGTMAEQASYYFENSGWVLDYLITSTYSGGKLTEFLYSGDDGTGEIIGVIKSEIFYNGNEIKEITASFNYGDTWIVIQKSAFTLQAGNTVKITNYYTQDGTTFEVDSYTDYTYDENNNLVGSAEDGDNDYRTEYEYEAGTGNYNQIFGISDYNIFEPKPFKKSGRVSSNFVNSRGQINLDALLKTHEALK